MNFEKQHRILGEILYERVLNLGYEKETVGKITAMFTDFDVLSLHEMLDIIEDD